MGELFPDAQYSTSHAYLQRSSQEAIREFPKR